MKIKKTIIKLLTVMMIVSIGISIIAIPNFATEVVGENETRSLTLD